MPDAKKEISQHTIQEAIDALDINVPIYRVTQQRGKLILFLYGHSQPAEYKPPAQSQPGESKTRCTATTKPRNPCQAWATPGSDPPRCNVHAAS